MGWSTDSEEWALLRKHESSIELAARFETVRLVIVCRRHAILVQLGRRLGASSTARLAHTPTGLETEPKGMPSSDSIQDQNTHFFLLSLSPKFWMRNACFWGLDRSLLIYYYMLLDEHSCKPDPSKKTTCLIVAHNIFCLQRPLFETSKTTAPLLAPPLGPQNYGCLISSSVGNGRVATTCPGGVASGDASCCSPDSTRKEISEGNFDLRDTARTPPAHLHLLAWRLFRVTVPPFRAMSYEAELFVDCNVQQHAMGIKVVLPFPIGLASAGARGGQFT